MEVSRDLTSCLQSHLGVRKMAQGMVLLRPGFSWLRLLLLVLVVGFTETGAQRLQATNQLPTARYRHTATSVSDRFVFFAGGYTAGGSVSNTIDVYNVARSSWSVRTMPHAHGDHSAVTVNNLVLLAGGYSNPYVDIYNLTDGSWSSHNITARAEMGATTLGNMAFFAGGQAIANFFDVVDIYNGNNNTWTGSNLSQGRSQLAATSVGFYALFAGGRAANQGYSDVVDIFNGRTNRWSNATLSEKRMMLAATTVRGKAIFAGGRTEAGASDVVDIFHFLNSSWTTAKLSVGRWLLTATTIGDVALFAGGYLNLTTFSDVVDVYNATSNTWFTLDPGLSLGRADFAAATAGNVALFGGGENPEDIMRRTLDIFAVDLISNATGTTSAGSVPVLEVNSTVSAIRLVPRDRAGILRPNKTLNVGFNLTTEHNSNDEVAQIGSIDPRSGGWRVIDDFSLNASNSFIYAANLIVTDPAGTPISSNRTTRIEVQFYLFEQRTDIRIGDNFTFRVDPSFAKFSVRLFDWPWKATNNTIELRMKLDPPFINFTRQATDEPGVTTFILEEDKEVSTTNGQTRVRVVDTVELDGVAVRQGGVAYQMDSNTSELVLRFSFFNSSLFYDPDLGVVFGESGSTSSSDNTWIIAVAVAVPAAIAIVLLVIVAAVLIGIVRRKKLNQESMINFDENDRQL